MPEGHREHEKWNPRRLRNWARGLGDEVSVGWTSQLGNLNTKNHPEQAYIPSLRPDESFP